MGGIHIPDTHPSAPLVGLRMDRPGSVTHSFALNRSVCASVPCRNFGTLANLTTFEEGCSSGGLQVPASAVKAEKLDLGLAVPAKSLGGRFLPGSLTPISTQWLNALCPPRGASGGEVTPLPQERVPLLCCPLS